MTTSPLRDPIGIDFDTSTEGLLELIARGPSNSVELRPTLPSDTEISKIFTAFANTQGGILIIGVAEGGKLGSLRNTDMPEILRALDRLSTLTLFSPAHISVTSIASQWLAYAIVDKAASFLLPVRTVSGAAYQRIEAKTEPLPETVPSFKSPPLPTNSPAWTVFVAMSFRDEEEPSLPDYFRAMDRAAQETGMPITINRIDKLEGDFEISRKIMDAIDAADAVIADFTLNASNVYFELGYARGCKKPIIQTARKGTDLEFDVRNWKTIFYKNATELEAALAPALQGLYKETIKNK